MNTDDQDWLDTLAGRDTPASAARREAQVLRAALRFDAHATLEKTPAQADASREARLLRRAADQGLPVAARQPPDRRPRWALPLAASVLVVFGAGLILQLQHHTGAPVVRGSADGIVHLTADDPAALKNRILEELRAAGTDATGYEALNVHGIDAELSLPVQPEISRVLAAHGIPVPADGILRVEIRSRE